MRALDMISAGGLAIFGDGDFSFIGLIVMCGAHKSSSHMFDQMNRTGIGFVRSFTKTHCLCSVPKHSDAPRNELNRQEYAGEDGRLFLPPARAALSHTSRANN